TFHEQIIDYLNGKRKSFFLPLDLRGTDFQIKVWKELIKIPYGETRTYKDVAKNINVPKGYRAVGNALNKNPILIVIPCHRVIGSGGKLTGFRGGLELKAKLLALEGITCKLM
ncbi:MAG: methylated-DNA--[protein]-cysteine S-methyltransferase, partial [Tissierellales bacterium]